MPKTPKPPARELPTLIPGQRSTLEQRLKLAKLVGQHYNAGATIRDMAARMGRSYGYVHTLLVESGVTLRTRGGSQPRTS